MKAEPVPNTLAVPCVADELALARTEAELAERLVASDRVGQPVTLLGGGSNVVLGSRLPGLTLLLRLRGTTCERLDGDGWRVTAAAGETWHDLVRITLARGIRGLENLALIPGLVGAAPVQNIGAYGRELGEVLESVTVFDRDRAAFTTLPRDECGLRYRDSRFRAAGGRCVIARLTLRLGTTRIESGYADVRRELGRMGVAVGDAGARDVACAVTRVRRRKLPDPRRVGNVGSFFKNPLVTARQLDVARARVDLEAHPADDHAGERFKISAARLIDAAGWKGRRRGAMQVWPNQPLVLVNRGGATGADALDLATAIADDVRGKFGVALELEPRVLGV